MNQQILWALLAAEAVFILVIIAKMVQKKRSRYENNEEEVIVTLPEEQPLDENMNFEEDGHAGPTQEK
jgi:hypothetical protein